MNTHRARWVGARATGVFVVLTLAAAPSRADTGAFQKWGGFEQGVAHYYDVFCSAEQRSRVDPSWVEFSRKCRGLVMSAKYLSEKLATSMAQTLAFNAAHAACRSFLGNGYALKRGTLAKSMASSIAKNEPGGGHNYATLRADQACRRYDRRGTSGEFRCFASWTAECVKKIKDVEPKQEPPPTTQDPQQDPTPPDPQTGGTEGEQGGGTEGEQGGGTAGGGAAGGGAAGGSGDGTNGVGTRRGALRGGTRGRNSGGRCKVGTGWHGGRCRALCPPCYPRCRVTIACAPRTSLGERSPRRGSHRAGLRRAPCGGGHRDRTGRCVRRARSTRPAHPCPVGYRRNAAGRCVHGSQALVGVARPLRPAGAAGQPSRRPYQRQPVARPVVRPTRRTYNPYQRQPVARPVVRPTRRTYNPYQRQPVARPVARPAHRPAYNPRRPAHTYRQPPRTYRPPQRTYRPPPRTYRPPPRRKTCRSVPRCSSYQSCSGYGRTRRCSTQRRCTSQTICN